MTEEEFLTFFDRKAKTFEKVYVLDDLDKFIAKNILTFFWNKHETIDLIETCVNMYFANSQKIVATIKEFAGSLDMYYHAAIEERKGSEEFNSLLRQTQKRMNQIEP